MSYVGMTYIITMSYVGMTCIFYIVIHQHDLYYVHCHLTSITCNILHTISYFGMTMCNHFGHTSVWSCFFNESICSRMYVNVFFLTMPICDFKSLFFSSFTCNFCLSFSFSSINLSRACNRTDITKLFSKYIFHVQQILLWQNVLKQLIIS